MIGMYSLMILTSKKEVKLSSISLDVFELIFLAKKSNDLVITLWFVSLKVAL